MRRAVSGAMCGLSVVVIAMALRASTTSTSHRVVEGVASAGIVGGSPSPSPTTSARPSPRPSPTTARRVTTTHAVTVKKTASPTPTRSASPSPKAVTSTTVNGDAVDTRYGPVQVQIVVRAGKIVQANAIEYPQDQPRDQEINSQAIPQLNDETLQAQSAQIDSVSGATYTSDGYVGSLQSAIDAAHKAGLL